MQLNYLPFRGYGRRALHGREQKNHECWEFILKLKSPFPLIFLRSYSRGLLRKTVARGLEGTCCMTTRVRRDLPSPAWLPLLQRLSETMTFSPTPGQGSSTPHSLESFYSPNHTNDCPAAPRAPRSTARGLPLCV